MAKIPIILEPGRADGKLATSDVIFDENKGMFQSEINDIQDTLNSDNPNKPLSAKQGKILKELLDNKVIEAGSIPIDTEPIEGNITHLVNSDGLAKEFNKHNTAIIQGNVYDVSFYNNGAVFESISTLLNSSDLDTLIPTSVRHGGMTIRFIQGYEQSSDNKYVQYRLMVTSFSTTVADWQGVDDEPIAGSENLVKSNGIFIDSLYTKANIDSVDIKEAINNNKHNGYVNNLGTVLSYNANWFYSDPILLKAGYMIILGLTTRSDVSALSIAQGDSVNVGDILIPINSKVYKATEDVYIVISGLTSQLLDKPIYIKNENPVAPFIRKIDKDFYGIGNTVRNKYIDQEGVIHDDNNSNIITYEVNQNDSIRWVHGNLFDYKSHGLCLFDREDNCLGYWSYSNLNGDLRLVNILDYPNAHHIIASFGKFLVNGDENTTPLVINDIGIKSIDRTLKGTYDTVKELNKKVSEIYTESYDEYGVIGINYPSEVKKVIEDIDKNIWGTKLHFCHTSDNHGSGFGYANEFTDLSPAKFLVNTGDLILDKFSDSFDTPKGLILAMDKPGFIVLGNHDVYLSTSIQERFEKYFAPLNEHNGLTGNTKTYYSVDYSQEKVKCIFLDIWDATGGSEGSLTSNSKMSSEQINWFAQELINAKSNNLHVACFVHISPDYVNYEKSPIDFYDFQVEKAVGASFLCDMIDKFIEGGTVTFTHNEQEYTFSFVAGGHFVGWFCGHMHCDCSGWMLNHPKQFSISVPRPGNNNMEEDGTYRIPKLGITFNYVTIDTRFQRLSILRIGNNKTIWGTPREGFSIMYN